jgi:hypothetical protein
MTETKRMQAQTNHRHRRLVAAMALLLVVVSLP